MNQAQLLAVAIKAIRQGEAALMKEFAPLHKEAYTFKPSHELVTRADLTSNVAIIRILKKLTPSIPVVSEEGGTLSEKEGAVAPLAWVLDPLDGTTNFTVRLPLWGISLALVQNGDPIIGVISLPLLKQRFHAVEGKGAWNGAHRIHVSKTKRLNLSTGLLCNGYRKNAVERYVRVEPALTRHSLSTRKLGAAVIEATWVASGFAEYSSLSGVHDWDVAAGALLVREAGGLSLTPDGEAWSLGEHDIVMCAPGIAKAVIRHTSA
jgi:myo-inositol-1(or 4)-monophosphatase